MQFAEAEWRFIPNFGTICGRIVANPRCKTMSRVNAGFGRALPSPAPPIHTAASKTPPPFRLAAAPGQVASKAPSFFEIATSGVAVNAGNSATWRRVFEFRYAPSLISLTLHCLVVLILGLISLGTQDSRGAYLAGVFSEDAPELSAQVFTPTVDLKPVSEPLSETIMGGGTADAVAALNLPLTNMGNSPVSESDLTEIFGGGGGTGGGDLTNLVEKSASFFGLSAKGNRFVFVIDSSTSMWGPRWIDVRKELVSSVRKLQPGQYFFVVCFDVTSISMFGAENSQKDFASADEANFRKLEYWLSQHTLGPGTKATSSLMEGLRLRPDAIFLLTDGEFQDDVLRILRMNNKNRSKKKPKIPVNTIGFHSQIGAPVLTQIASENNGKFKYVAPPPDLQIFQGPRPGFGQRVYPPQSIEEMLRSL
jgi:hypothetical protein